MLLAAATTAHAGKSNDTLNVVWDREQTTLDVYYFTDHSGLTVMHNVWDGLIYRDPATGQYLPLLATAWDWESPTSLVMSLREGVKFHNGEEFDADDVVYTINYVTNPDNKVLLLQMVSWLDSAEKIDKYKVRVRLKKPFSAALEYLATGVPIYPNEYYAKVGTAGMGKHPIGTGPYKVVSFTPGREYTLERYDDYMSGVPKQKAAIKRVAVRTQKDNNIMIGELMTERSDFLWRLTADQSDQLERMPNVRVVRSPTMRIAFLVFDTLDKDSPFSKPEVRQAIAHAVNRDAIAKNLVRGAATRLDTVCYPMQNGCPTTVPMYNYDPKKAREMLAKAGYPDGFETPIAGTSDRHITEAVIGDLQAVGIRTKLDFLVWATFRDRWVKGEMPLFHASTGFWGIGDASIAFGTYFADMPQDLSRNPEVTDAINKANLTYDMAERKALYTRAQDIILENAYWLPLVTITNNFAFSKNLNFDPTFDEINRFYTASWK
ncbi:MULTISPECIES: ABC transporter substrate-binding protein [unclassified Chelatococcus]|uniref:ABC transporter substrate-binding protein n=1 Tax=unclassified Chelatococcus TaxID=2638111 RepID=UPI001BCCB9CE|nr:MULTISPECIES: ABC transporter substrate-binding protein [unclassified Chelatococcus]MBS7700385.1 ABC transporter substrate-binding protein [Chelatococcus sp. YT9]MBX3556181.1 ABC transporter substrate-binding protein [Chelatococcus sp.]